jgi:plasmid stability protein
MPIVLMLPPELATILRNRAANEGQAVESIALEILSQVLIEPQQQDAEAPSLLKLAALSAIEDYAPGSDLLAFESIDGEDFPAYEAI